MELTGAQILDPMGGHAHKPKKTSHHKRLPPVGGVGFDDPEVMQRIAEAAEIEVEAHVEPVKLPEPMPGVIAMGDWQFVVGWDDILARFEPLARAAAERAARAPASAKAAEEADEADAPPQRAMHDAAAAASKGPSPSRPAAEATAAAWKPEASPATAAVWKPEASPATAAAWKPQASPATAAAWKPEASPATAAAWKPEASPATAAAWKPEASPATAAAWKPEASPATAAAWKPEPAAAAPTPARAAPRLPADTLQKVAVLMKRGELGKSEQILDLWLKSHPDDKTAQKMKALCQRGQQPRAAEAPKAAAASKLPAPNPDAVPIVDMGKLMTATGFTPTDAFILSRIDGTTPVKSLTLLVPEMTSEALTSLLVRSWKAGVLHFKTR